MNNASCTAETETNSIAYTYGEEVVILTVWSTITLPTIFLNILMIVSVVTYKRFHTVSYVFVVSMSVSEMVALTARVVLAVPTTLWFQLTAVGPPDVSHEERSPSVCDYLWSLGFLIAITRRTITPHMLLIAINRYSRVACTSHYSKIFTKRLTVLYITLCWIVGCLMCIPYYTNDFAYYYEPLQLSFIHDLNKNGYPLFYWVMYFCEGVIVLTTCTGLYFGLLFKLQTARRVRQSQVSPLANRQQANTRGMLTNAEELCLTLQNFVVYFVYAVGWILNFVTFQWLESLSDSDTSRGHSRELVVRTMFNLIWIVNYSINVYVYMIFNATLRKHMMSRIKTSLCKSSIER